MEKEVNFETDRKEQIKTGFQLILHLLSYFLVYIVSKCSSIFSCKKRIKKPEKKK